MLLARLCDSTCEAAPVDPPPPLQLIYSTLQPLLPLLPAVAAAAATVATAITTRPPLHHHLQRLHPPLLLPVGLACMAPQVVLACLCDSTSELPQLTPHLPPPLQLIYSTLTITTVTTIATKGTPPRGPLQPPHPRKHPCTASILALTPCLTLQVVLHGVCNSARGTS